MQAAGTSKQPSYSDVTKKDLSNDFNEEKRS